MKKLNRQDLLDILYGCTILGTGGGGSLKRGIERIDIALNNGKEFILVDFDDLNEEDLIATPYACGAISPLSDEEKQKFEKYEIAEEDPHLTSVKEMEKYLGKDIKALISTELGGGNAACAMYCAAMLGKYILDADPAGRSVPELQHSTYYLNDISIAPMALVNKFGESVVLTNVIDDNRAEEMVRALAVASQNTIAVVDHVENAKNLKNAVIRGAITNAWKLGTAYREAVENKENIAEKIARAGKGKVLFKGTIEKNEWGTVKGFTVGTMVISGKECYENHEMKIWYKNENIISWIDGEYAYTVPDLITVIDNANNEVILNPHGEEGKDVTVIGLPAPEEWTTVLGLEVFGPKSFGYDVEWEKFKI